MSDVNACVIGGRLTRDAETKNVGAKGTALTKFGLANNTGFGQYAKSQFFEVQLWGQRGTAIQHYLSKGQAVIVVGVLENAAWTGNDGVKHDNWTITATDVQFINDSRADGMKEEEPTW